MNHSGDTNKMVSDTPRTDEAKKIVLGGVGGDWEVVHIAFSRQLERELNAANSRIELLMSANADVARIAEERDAAEKRIRLLIAKLDKYQDSIKRLEKAGDALYVNSDPTRWDSLQAANRKLDQQEEWRKAKEAKP